LAKNQSGRVAPVDSEEADATGAYVISRTSVSGCGTAGAICDFSGAGDADALCSFFNLGVAAGFGRATLRFLVVAVFLLAALNFLVAVAFLPAVLLFLG
jgi:hypothetical protein